MDRRQPANDLSMVVGEFGPRRYGTRNERERGAKRIEQLVEFAHGQVNSEQASECGVPLLDPEWFGKRGAMTKEHIYALQAWLCGRPPAPSDGFVPTAGGSLGQIYAILAAILFVVMVVVFAVLSSAALVSCTPTASAGLHSAFAAAMELGSGFSSNEAGDGPPFTFSPAVQFVDPSKGPTEEGQGPVDTPTNACYFDTKIILYQDADSLVVFVRNPEAWGAVEGVEFKKVEELPVGVPGLKLEGREYLQLSLNGAFTDSAAKLKCTGGISVCGFGEAVLRLKPGRLQRTSVRARSAPAIASISIVHRATRPSELPPQRIFKLLKEALAKKAQEIKVKNEDRRADDEIGAGRAARDRLGRRAPRPTRSVEGRVAAVDLSPVRELIAAKQRAKAAEEELAEYPSRRKVAPPPCSDTSSTAPASSPPLKPLSDAPPADLPDVRPRSKPELLVVDSKEKRSEKTDELKAPLRSRRSICRGCRWARRCYRRSTRTSLAIADEGVLGYTALSARRKVDVLEFVTLVVAERWRRRHRRQARREGARCGNAAARDRPIQPPLDGDGQRGPLSTSGASTCARVTTDGRRLRGSAVPMWSGIPIERTSGAVGKRKKGDETLATTPSGGGLSPPSRGDENKSTLCYMNASLQLLLAASGFATNLMKLSEYGGVVGALGKLFVALTTSDRDLVLSRKGAHRRDRLRWVGLPDQRRKPADVKKEKKKLGTTAHQDAEEFVTALLTQLHGKLSASSLVQDAFGSVSVVGETKRVLPFSLLEVPSGTGDFGATILQRLRR